MANTSVYTMCHWLHPRGRFDTHARKSAVDVFFLNHRCPLLTLLSRWLIDTDQDEEGMQVIADLHGGDLDDPIAVAEFQEIKGKVREDVSMTTFSLTFSVLNSAKRESGEDRSYRMMWRKYKRRVLLAMSSQAFAQLVRLFFHTTACS